jgi:RNA polymerase sigma-70 factor (ECF subfamily)
LDEFESAIDGCIAGDQQSWTLLVRRCERDLTRQMWRFSRDPGVCGELVQDVLVELFYSLPRYKRRGVPFEHWLRRIATRVGYRYWKRKRRTSAYGQELVEQDLPSGSAGPLEKAAASDAAALLHKLLAELRPADRLVLTLMYFEECDISQIAQRTGWNRAVVKMRLMRARRRLRQIVDERQLAQSLENLAHGQPAMDRPTRPASPA